MSAILEEGVDPEGEYNIPVGLPKDKVIEQLKIVLSNAQKQPPLKIPKVEKDSAIATVDLTGKPAKASDNQKTFSIFSPRNASQSPATLKPATASSSASPQSSSGLQKKLDDKEFFKERAAMFRAKNPELMRAPSPPPKLAQPALNPSFLEAKMHEYLSVILPRGQMADKLKKAAPYNVFLTTVAAAPETHSDPLSVTFQELLDPSLGDLESSVQFNFMIDIGWLLAHYAFASCHHQPLLIFYGQDMEGLSDINKKRPNVTSVKVNIPTPIGCHHTKMMFFFYKDKSMRIVVSTGISMRTIGRIAFKACG